MSRKKPCVATIASPIVLSVTFPSTGTGSPDFVMNVDVMFGIGCPLSACMNNTWQCSTASG